MADPNLELIYFEPQLGDLCGKHALNMLVQSDTFSIEYLAELGQNLNAVQNFLTNVPQQAHVEASGNFSYHVVQAALHSLQPPIEIDSLRKNMYAEYREDPSKAFAYIINRDNEHWFTIRRFRESKIVWFLLDSLRSGPIPISALGLKYCIDEYLKTASYSVFIVVKELRKCGADVAKFGIPAGLQNVGVVLRLEGYDLEYKAALERSKRDRGKVYDEEESVECQIAIRESLEEHYRQQEEKRVGEERFLKALQHNEESALLQQALSMSLENNAGDSDEASNRISSSGASTSTTLQQQSSALKVDDQSPISTIMPCDSTRQSEAVVHENFVETLRQKRERFLANLEKI